MEDEIKASHDVLTSVACQLGCTRSTLVGSVSRHELPATASFANLKALHNTVKQQSIKVAQRAYIATSGGALVFSSKMDAVRAVPVDDNCPTLISGAMSNRAKRKRELLREDQEQQVEQARKRLSTVSQNLSTELDLAQTVVNQLVSGLRGPSGEIAIHSCSMFTRKLTPSDDHSRVVVAFRVCAGIPILVAQLKRCLGSCWGDGVVSREDSVNGVCNHDLPLSDEGLASVEMGNRPMLIVTSVPRAAPADAKK